MSATCHEEREVSRLELYSDAVFSILATISILPAMEGLKESNQFDASSMFLIVLVYFSTFFIIIIMYYQHMCIFNRLYKLSVFLLTLNTIHMGLLSLFPFINGLVMDYSEVSTPYYFHGALYVGAYTTHSIISVYIGCYSETDVRTMLWYIRVVPDARSIWNLIIGYSIAEFGHLLVFGCVAIIAAFKPEYGFLGYASIYPIYRLLHKAMRLIDKTQKYDNESLSEIRKKSKFSEFSSYLPKERIIAFSDGIFAIGITLTVVNLRSPEIEEPEESSYSGEEIRQDLNEALLDMWPQFVSFIFSFMIIGLFWFWHHRVFSVIIKVSMGLFRANTIFLALIGVLPATSELVGAFFLDETTAETATRNLSIAIFLCTSSLIFFWFWTGSKYAADVVDNKSPLMTRRNRQLVYIGLLIPIVASLICIATSWISILVAQIGFTSLFLLPFYTLAYLAIVRRSSKYSSSGEQIHLINEFTEPTERRFE